LYDLGNDPWYWRAKAVRNDVGADESSWTTILVLTVDTGGALPTGYDPDPSVDIRCSYIGMEVTFRATVTHVLTTTATAALRLQVQRDTLVGFPAPVTETSTWVMGGGTASAVMVIPGPGDYWFRFRTLADYGDDSAWDTYETTVLLMAPFVGREPTWELHAGSKVTRVYCPIEGSSPQAEGTALVVGTPAADEVQVWEPVENMATVDADAVALAILNHLRARNISVSGAIPLTNAIELDREITVEYNRFDNDGNAVLDETDSVPVAKVEHEITVGRNPETRVWVGDYNVPLEQVIAAKLAELEQKTQT